MLLVELTGSCKALPEQIALMGLNVGNVGFVTFTVTVVAQPVFAVYVMVVFPKVMALTKPVLETVANAGLLDVQALLAAAVPEPVNWELVFGHNTVFPEIFGIGFTVTVTALRTGLTQGPFTPSI